MALVERAHSGRALSERCAPFDIMTSSETEVGMPDHPPRSRRGFVAGAAGVALVVLTTLPVSAHHGWGGYVDQLSDISGTVETPVSLAGPHATLKVKAGGHLWDVVLAPPPRTEAAGLKEGMIPVGATVTVHGQRHRDPERFEIKTTRLTWNDHVYNVYPDRK
jgi:hypothetical protein